VFIGSIALLIAAILFAGFLTSSLAMAQQQQQTTTAPGTTTAPLLPPPSSSSATTGQTTSSGTSSIPLTPQEQEQLNRLQNVIAATNQNLDEAEKQVGGIVYTPRWSDPVWVEPDSSAVLVAYCLPGEFAESGQEILGGGFELEVLESYEVALPQNFTAWMMVIGNEDRQNRYLAAVGVICASDANDAETRVVSPEEQQQINNVVQQITQVTSIDQVINIINNATTPGGGTPTTPGGGTPTTPGGGTPTTPGGGTPTITATANPAIYNGVPCPSPLEFSGTITSNVGNTEVAYRFIFSTGAATPEQIIHFNQPGSQTVSFTSPGIAPPSLQGWVAIEIVEPFTLQSNQAEMQITCTATPPSGGTITASLSANPATYNGPCPARIEFSGTITDNVGNRDVTYRFIFSDGATQAMPVIHFNQPGSQTVSTSWTLGGNTLTSYQGWAAIEILQPVQLQSNRAEFSMTCTPSTEGAPLAPQTLQAENTTTTTDEEDTTAPPATTDDEEEEEDTTTDGAGGGGGGGTDTGGTDNGDQSPPPAGTTTTDGAGGGGGGGTDGSTDGDAEPP
jgi:hypothetical protein